MADQLNIERVRSLGVSSSPPKPVSSRVPPHGSKFLKGPIPLSWLSAAAKLPGKCCQVGTALWYRAGLQKTGTIRLSYETLAIFGVDRWAYHRALGKMKVAGLISVADRGIGKSPFITLLDAPACRS